MTDPDQPPEPREPGEDTTDDAGEPVLVDALGKPCPQPVIELARAVAELTIGGRVRLLADDEAAWVDVPVWCRMQRQRLVSKERDGRLHTFVVERVR